MNKKIASLALILGVIFLASLFFLKNTSAQVCLPLTGYLVWPGTWEPGRIPMASSQQYVLTGSPFYVSGTNVGLGTTNPVYTLQVNGDISGTRLCIGSDCRSVWPGGGVAGSGSAGQVTFWTGATNVSGDNNLFWDNTNKRLGIGTTTPQTSLHIIGNVTANTFLGTINASNVSSGQFGANTGGGNYYFMGNVGIGTTAPGAKLEVQGQVKIVDGTQGAGKVLTSDANGLASWQTPAGGVPSGFSILGDTPTPPPGYTYTGNVIELPLVSTWTTKAPMPTGRARLAAASPGNGKIYAIGGYNSSGGYLATNEEYDPATNTWTTKAPMPTAREGLAAASPGNGKIYAIGGYNGSDGILATNEEYDPATNTWTRKAPMPTARTSLAAVSPGNGKIYAIGGGGSGSTIFATNEEYDPATNTWRTKAPMPTARTRFAAASPGNGKIYAIGGTRGPDYLSTNEEYDPATNTWTTKAPMPTGRIDLAAVSPGNGKIYAIGGSDSYANVSTNEEYDPVTNIWRVKEPMPTRRFDLAAASPGNGKIYAIGGLGAGALALVTNEEYTTFSIIYYIHKKD